MSLKELVESARKADPEAFRKMVTATEKEFPTSGKNRFASTPIEVRGELHSFIQLCEASA